MNEDNYWNDFMCTGSVASYLKYRNHLNKRENKSSGHDFGDLGDTFDAGNSKFDRDDFKN